MTEYCNRTERTVREFEFNASSLPLALRSAADFIEGVNTNKMWVMDVLSDHEDATGWYVRVLVEDKPSYGTRVRIEPVVGWGEVVLCQVEENGKLG